MLLWAYCICTTLMNKPFAEETLSNIRLPDSKNNKTRTLTAVVTIHPTILHSHLVHFTSTTLLFPHSKPVYYQINVNLYSSFNITLNKKPLVRNPHVSLQHISPNLTFPRNQLSYSRIWWAVGLGCRITSKNYWYLGSMFNHSQFFGEPGSIGFPIP